MTNLELHNAIVLLMNDSKLNPVEIYGVISSLEAITRFELLGFVRSQNEKKEKPND